MENKMLISKEKEASYLETQDLFYRLGWTACSRNLNALSVRKVCAKEKSDKELFDQGYGDCFANGESEPVVEETTEYKPYK